MEKIRLTIFYGQDGKVSVMGPIHDKILCYGLLELAKEAVRDYEPEEKKILVPSLIPPGTMKPGN